MFCQKKQVGPTRYYQNSWRIFEDNYNCRYLPLGVFTSIRSLSLMCGEWMLWCLLKLVEKSVAVICGMWFKRSKLFVFPIILSGRCLFSWRSSMEPFRSRRIAAAAAARLSNWLTVAPGWPFINNWLFYMVLILWII